MEEQEQARRVPFLQSYYANDCLWARRLGRLEVAQSERVDSVSSTETKAEVITSRLADGEPGVFCEIRYRLEAKDGGWLIHGVDLQCCCGDGKRAEANCPACHGTGWKDTDAVLARIHRR